MMGLKKKNLLLAAGIATIIWAFIQSASAQNGGVGCGTP